MSQSKQTKNYLPLKTIFWAIIAISMGGIIYFSLKPAGEHAPITYTEPVHSQPKAPAQMPSTIIPELSSELPTPALPKVAIIIDDIGYKKKIAADIIALELNLSFSILPQSPYATFLAEKISTSGKDLLLHLPLEPTDSKWDPGPGALMLSMAPKTIWTELNQNLTGFAFIGINNHMGSKFTADPKAMRALISAVKDKELFFVDSLTSSKSVAYKTAKELGVKTAKRNIFLDNEQTPQAIQNQLKKLISIATKRGSAIGIGHPYPATLKALATFQDKLLAEVELVGIHELVK